MKLDYIITGTGRCGTAYAAKFLTREGIPCGHEEIFGPWGKRASEIMRQSNSELVADASWLAMPFLNEVGEAKVVHLVRHPQRVIASMLAIGLFANKPPRDIRPYTAFAYEHSDIGKYETEIERATAFYLYWNGQISYRRPDAHIARIEDEPESILNAVGIRIKGIPAEGKKWESGIEPVNVTGVDPISLNDIPESMRSDILAMMEDYGYGPLEVNEKPHVYWAALMERNIHWRSHNALQAVAEECVVARAQRLQTPYARTDDNRNQLTKAFLIESQRPDDTLVMLDIDHDHPPDIVQRLSERKEGVVGALAFRRSEPHDPLWFVRNPDGDLVQFLDPDEWNGQVFQCSAVGTGAIAIKRWVFDKLREAGFKWPWFKYEYPDDGRTGLMPSEDMYFSKICEQAGISMHVHTGVEIPHFFMNVADEELWRQKIEDKEE